ncbi:restriction endonuclease subunit S [Salmonella enterica]|nr:restriction endonuclease subunit S [Salmonella enterica]EEA2272823.1 restriction endonuclease subunit S [Salmonella enterica]EGB7057935.1 restriction endonuclease subunit S [Salmonella enterica]EKL9525395.1 restriction endonuclease subunit S [Salmonella enterica]
MGSKWKTSFLTDHYIISSGLSKPAKDFGTGYPFLSFKDIFYNYFLPDSLTQLVQSTDKERAACSVKRGDVFLTRTSETMHELGMSSVALKDYVDATFNGFCKRLRPKETSELEPEYVGYYLRSPLFRQSMLAFSTMSTRASLNNEMISRLEISYPDRKIQKKIANILLSLDKKIAISRAINQTLEKMSQILFKSWFVDFNPVIDNALDAGNPIPEALQSRAELRQKVRNSADFKPLPADIRALFPAEFEETELGWMPKGWHHKHAEEIATISIGKTPPRNNKECFSEKKGNNYTWVSIKDLGNCNVFIKESSEYLTTDAVNNYNVKVVPKGAVLLSFKLTIGRIAIAANTLTTNEAIAHFYNMKHGVNKEYLYSYLQNFDYNSLGSTSSIATAVNSKIIRKIPVLVPDAAILNQYKTSIDIIFERIRFNNENTDDLTALRDTLLPKLISGELSLEDLPDLVNQTEPA